MSTRIRVNTRPREWYQVRSDALYSPELTDHMAAIAGSEWRRHHGFRTIIVTATDEITGEVVEVVHGEVIPACPRCGFEGRRVVKEA